MTAKQRTARTRRRLTAEGVTSLVADVGTLTADAARRQLSGRVLPYGTPARTSAGNTRFTPGSCQAAVPAHVALLVEHDRNRVAGYAATLTETPAGLDATFTIPPGPIGDQVLADAAAGLRTGLSVGVDVTASSPGTDGILTVTGASLREVSVVSVPAWSDARVVAVAATAPGPDAGDSTPPAPAAPVAPAPAAPAPAMVPAAFYTAARPPLTVADVSQLLTGVRSGTRDAAELRAALTDIVPANDAGAGVFRPAWIGELWMATNAERPMVDSVQSQALPATGTKVQGFTWATKPGGGTYAGAKAAIPSQGATTVPAESPLVRWAGGNDIDRIYFDRGDASFQESYFRMMAADYALDTEAALTAALVAAATAGDVAATTILKVVADAAGKLAAIGARLGFVAVAGNLYASLLGITNANAPWLLSGNASITDSTANLGGVRLFVAPSLAASTALAGDRRAATFYEDRPPIRVKAENIPNGGIDLALFGYYATLVNDGRALLKYGGLTALEADAEAPAAAGGK